MQQSLGIEPGNEATLHVPTSFYLVNVPIILTHFFPQDCTFTVLVYTTKSAAASMEHQQEAQVGKT